MNEEEIFHQALGRSSPEERAAYLQQACGGNSALRASVEALLRANIGASGFLDRAVPALMATVDDPISERPGTLIGAYKLLEQIGEGGFGVVFMAEQTEPVRRKVALKILKPGMDTRQVIARFEAERQALALMDHPNIAHILDGGETTSGRPYFVMQLVRGVPITEFCDQSHLSVRERLELFLSVCHAVQHAHHKGIIHRDLKPSNVLVTLHDDKAVVKVIDFGIAKAMGQQLTDKTLFTNFAQMIGTPLYMSPEQAQMSGLDVDTRSDVYSLGVLLYELLTGVTPFDKERLRTGGYDEIRRMIREEEPPKPSTRVSTLAQAAGTAAANRQSDPKRLRQLLRGELDWIVMKALEKDRNRRYETASAFAADVQRYLHDEPVLACSPSAGYRFRKFARRNKAALATAMAVAVAVLLAVVGLAVSNLLITREGDLKEAALKEKVRALKDKTSALGTAKAKEAEAELQRQRAELNFHKVLGAVDQMLATVGEAKELARLPQAEAVQRALLKKALAIFQGFLLESKVGTDTRLERAWASARLGLIYGMLKDEGQSEQAYGQAIALFEQLVKDFPRVASYRRELANTHSHRATVLVAAGRQQEAEAAYRRGVEVYEGLASKFPENVDHRMALVMASFDLETFQKYTLERPQAAEATRLQGLQVHKKLLEDFPDHFPYHEWLGGRYNKFFGLLGAATWQQELLTAYRPVLEVQQNLVQCFPDNAHYRFWLAYHYRRLGRHLGVKQPDEAVKALLRSLELFGKLTADFPPGIDYSVMAFYLYGLGGMLKLHSKPQEAERAFRHARGVYDKLMAGPSSRPQDLFHRIATLHHLAGLLRDRGALAEARSLQEEAHKWYDHLAQGTGNTQPPNEELRRFRAEAAALLGIKGGP